MARSTAWKNTEREVARFFGTMRKVGSGGMGRSDHVRSDAHHPKIFIEVKNKKVYTSVVDHLSDFRKLTGKFSNVGFLEFPDQGTVAVHSSDLIHLALAGLGVVDYGYMGLAVPRLRKSFKDFADAEQLAAGDGQNLTVLAFKKPKVHGFVLLVKADKLVDIAKWHAAGQLLVNEVATAAGRDELRPDISEELMKLSNVDDTTQLFLECLTSFKHHWQIPKRKNLNEHRKKRSGIKGTSRDGEEYTPDWVEAAVEGAQRE